MDGPVPPNRWALEDNAAWVSTVAQDVLRVCADHSATCERRLGTAAHMPLYLMDAIIDGTLPCLAELPWLTQHRAALYTNFMTASQYAHILMGPFWARVERCSTSDVEQLNFFNTQRQALEPSAPKPPFYSYGLSIIIGASEVRTDWQRANLAPVPCSPPIADPNRSCSSDQTSVHAAMTHHRASADSFWAPFLAPASVFTRVRFLCVRRYTPLLPRLPSRPRTTNRWHRPTGCLQPLAWRCWSRAPVMCPNSLLTCPMRPPTASLHRLPSLCCCLPEPWILKLRTGLALGTRRAWVRTPHS